MIKQKIYEFSKRFRGKGLGRRFPILRGLQRNIVKSIQNKSDHFKIVEGHKMYLDENDDLKLMVNSGYEFDEFVKTGAIKHIKKGSMVVDIGAHIGYNTLHFAKLVGENGRVYAFEPDPVNFKLLELNVLINGYKNVICLNKAVSGKTDKIKFYLSKISTNPAMNKDCLQSEEIKEVIWIDSIKLDDYFRDKRVDFIKVDTTGSEGEILLGAKDLIASNKNIGLFIEFVRAWLDKSKVSSKELLKFLESNNFKVFNSNLDKLISTKEMLRTYSLDESDWTNIFCFRKI